LPISPARAKAFLRINSMVSCPVVIMVSRYGPCLLAERVVQPSTVSLAKALALQEFRQALPQRRPIVGIGNSELGKRREVAFEVSDVEPALPLA